MALAGLVCAIVALYRGATSDEVGGVQADVVAVKADTSAIALAVPDLATKSDLGNTRRNAWKGRKAAEAGAREAYASRLAADRAAKASEAVQAELPKLAHRSDLYSILAAAKAAEVAAKAVPAPDFSGLATKAHVTTEIDRHTQYMEDLIARQKVKVTDIVEE